MATTRIAVLAKPPTHGRCKSRLAEGIGPGAAARLARAMLLDAWDTARRVAERRDDTDLVLAQSDEDAWYPLVLPTPARVAQGTGDLGRRMARLVARAAADGASRVLLLGTDTPALPVDHVQRALDALQRCDLVLGPVPDGGFWCLGARVRDVFRDETWLDHIPWDEGETRAAVCARAASLGLSVGDVPGWFDVDRVDDLHRLRAALARDDAAAPRSARALAELDAARAGPEHALLSVIVPTLDEGRALDACLDALGEQAGPLEIVVADGGSRDGSVERCVSRPEVTACIAPRGRGSQLRAGAALATADALLFVHVDVRLPRAAVADVRRALAAGHEAGAFLTRTVADPSPRNPLGPLLRLADVRSRVTRHPYGDQCLFVTRAAYESVGGFRPQPLMEDYDLSRRLAARRPLARVRSEVLVSGRRFQRRPLRSLLLMRVLPTLYRMGVDPRRLARLYEE